MKSSSWVQTPSDIRELGGALFCDYRFGHVFIIPQWSRLLLSLPEVFVVR